MCPRAHENTPAAAGAQPARASTGRPEGTSPLPGDHPAMGTARLAIYLVGLVVVVAAVWVFLTQTSVGRSIPSGVALALILLLVGIGVMAGARSLNDRRVTSRVMHDAPPGPAVVERHYAYDRPGDTYVPPAPGETVA